ncbi:MAG: adenylate/guanylate cyclase domain-containing protein [Actinobacteria bacterium]|nr:adenylate/guanylate cyclase domain-containing protein [Actinomycetota bacterium]
MPDDPDFSKESDANAAGPMTPPPATGMGTERPEDVPPTGGPIALERTFAFIDICGFTALTERHGPRRAVRALEVFRSAVKEVAGRRGVRVAKWLGDGVLLVGVKPGPIVATVAEMTGRFESFAIDLRAGVASGTALLFDGDDYIGRPVNLAARLCDEAEPGQLLAHPSALNGVPDWVEIGPPKEVTVRGVGPIEGVRPLRPSADVQFPPEPNRDSEI